MADRFSKAKDLASEKWGDLATAVGTQRQVRRLQKQIAELVAERDRTMTEIGRKVYALYGRDKVRNADIIPLCERIGAIGTDIDELNEEVRELSQPRPRGELGDIDLEDETELDEEAEEEEPTEPQPEAEEETEAEEELPPDEPSEETEEAPADEPETEDDQDEE